MDIISGFYIFLFSKDTLNSILLSLISSFVAYLVAILFRIRIPDLSIPLFWKQFSQGLNIAASEVKRQFEPRMRPGQKPSLLPLGEVVALGELFYFFRARCKTDPSIASISNEADFDTVKDNNLLIVGGPQYNDAASAFVQGISSELFYQFKRLSRDGVVETNDPKLKVFVGKNASYPNFVTTQPQTKQPARQASAAE